MVVHDGHHVRARLVNLAMDESLAVAGALEAAYRIAVEIVFDKIIFADQSRREGSGKKIMIGIPWVANADMSVSVQDSFIRQYVIGGLQIVELHRERLL